MMSDGLGKSPEILCVISCKLIRVCWQLIFEDSDPVTCCQNCIDRHRSVFFQSQFFKIIMQFTRLHEKKQHFYYLSNIFEFIKNWFWWLLDLPCTDFRIIKMCSIITEACIKFNRSWKWNWIFNFIFAVPMITLGVTWTAKRWWATTEMFFGLRPRNSAAPVIHYSF